MATAADYNLGPNTFPRGWFIVADDIPYHDGPCPKSASIRSYPVVDNMGCIMAWYDADGRAPDYEAPSLPQWDDPQWVRWELDHLGELAIHTQEILANMADVRHLGPHRSRDITLQTGVFR